MADISKSKSMAHRAKNASFLTSCFGSLRNPCFELVGGYGNYSYGDVNTPLHSCE